TDAHLHIVFSSSFSRKKEIPKKRRSRQCSLGQLAYFPALSLKPAVNPRLACFPLALFVWVHSARYVKRLASTLSMAAVWKGRRGTDLDPHLSHPASYRSRSTASQCSRGAGEIECQSHNERQKASSSLFQKISPQ